MIWMLNKGLYKLLDLLLKKGFYKLLGLFHPNLKRFLPSLQRLTMTSLHSESYGTWPKHLGMHMTYSDGKTFKYFALYVVISQTQNHVKSKIFKKYLALYVVRSQTQIMLVGSFT